MRIISGKNKGRNIQAPGNLPVRPTTDRAKESLFNILHNQYDLDECRVLDLFCGTGNISFEFASRGCQQVDAVDIESACTKFVAKISMKLDYQIFTHNIDFKRFLTSSGSKWDIIFADPPYDFEGYNDIPDLIFQHQLLDKEGTLIIEHDKYHDFSSYTSFEQQRNYGKVHFSFFR